LLNKVINSKRKINPHSYMTQASFIRHQSIDPGDALSFAQSMFNNYIK